MVSSKPKQDCPQDLPFEARCKCDFARARAWKRKREREREKDRERETERQSLCSQSGHVLYIIESKNIILGNPLKKSVQHFNMSITFPKT